MEIRILDFIQSLRNPLFDSFFKLFTTIGNHGELWILIIVILLFTKRYRKIALFALGALILEVVLVEGIIKGIFERPRPFLLHENIQLIIPKPLGFSFPSGHTASAFAVATLLFLNKVPLRKTIIGLAVLMGFSRLYVYVHYPTDVLAGMILGIGVGWFVYYIQRKILKENLEGGLV